MKTHITALICLIIVGVLAFVMRDTIVNLNHLFSGKLWLLGFVFALFFAFAITEFFNPSFRSRSPSKGSKQMQQSTQQKFSRELPVKRKSQSIRTRKRATRLTTAALIVGLALLLIPLSGEARTSTSLSSTLEEGIYQMEVLENSEAALANFNTIIQRKHEALPSVWAEAIARSAVLTGQKGKNNEAIQHLKMLREDRNPASEQWAEWADTFLHRLQTPPFRPAPWKTGEYLTFRLQSLSGDTFGFACFWSGTYDQDDIKLHDFRSWMYVAPSHVTQTGRLLASMQSEEEVGFTPHTFWGKVTIDDHYRHQINWDTRTLQLFSGEQMTVEHPLPPLMQPLDSDLVFHIPRLLDAEVTPHMCTQVIVPGGYIGDAVYEFSGFESRLVDGIEKQTERWQVDLSISNANIQKFTIWVSTEAERQVLSVNAGVFTMELDSASLRPSLEPLRKPHPTDPMLYTVPSGWVSFDKIPSEQRSRIYLISEDGHAMAIFLSSHARDGETRLELVLEEELSSLKRLLPEYQTKLEEGTFLHTTIAEQPAIGSVGTFTDKGRSQRDQRYYFLHEDRVHWLVLRAPESKWELYQNDFDQLIAGIKLNTDNQEHDHEKN